MASPQLKGFRCHIYIAEIASYAVMAGYQCGRNWYVTQADLVAAVEATGFDARVLSAGAAPSASVATAVLRVGGMTCGACAGAVERACLGVPGVARAAVSALAGRAEVTFDPDRAGPRHLLAAVQDAGFEAALADSDRCVEGFAV